MPFTSRPADALGRYLDDLSPYSSRQTLADGRRQGSNWFPTTFFRRHTRHPPRKRTKSCQGPVPHRWRVVLACSACKRRAAPVGHMSRPSYISRHAPVNSRCKRRCEQSRAPCAGAWSARDAPFSLSLGPGGVLGSVQAPGGTCDRSGPSYISRPGIHAAKAGRYEQSRAMCGRVVSSRRPIFAQPGAWGCAGERASAGRHL
jgi:hypothetical protein